MKCISKVFIFLLQIRFLPPIGLIFWFSGIYEIGCYDYGPDCLRACPDWYSAEGGKAWLFADEVDVE